MNIDFALFGLSSLVAATCLFVNAPMISESKPVQVPECESVTTCTWYLTTPTVVDDAGAPVQSNCFTISETYYTDNYKHGKCHCNDAEDCVLKFPCAVAADYGITLVKPAPAGCVDMCMYDNAQGNVGSKGKKANFGTFNNFMGWGFTHAQCGQKQEAEAYVFDCPNNVAANDWKWKFYAAVGCHSDVCNTGGC